MRSSNFKYYCYFIPARLRSLLRWVFLEWRKLGIRRGDIVVDFGSGGRPLLRADVLVDKFLEGCAERLNEFLDTGALVVQCDLSNLPFRDKSIDFGYSSHVIEHLEKLEESLQEMQRVCKRGFITCPSAFREQMMALKVHIWFVENKDGRLVITRKTKPYPEYIGGFFEGLMTAKKKYIWYNFENELADFFFVNYRWEGKIDYKIRGQSGAALWKQEGEAELQPAKSVALSFRKKMFVYSAKTIRHLFSKKFDIKRILCCPFCGGALLIDQNFVRCERCKVRFKHKNRRMFNFVDSESYE